MGNGERDRKPLASQDVIYPNGTKWNQMNPNGPKDDDKINFKRAAFYLQSSGSIGWFR